MNASQTTGDSVRAVLSPTDPRVLEQELIGYRLAYSASLLTLLEKIYNLIPEKSGDEREALLSQARRIKQELEGLSAQNLAGQQRIAGKGDFDHRLVLPAAEA